MPDSLGDIIGGHLGKRGAGEFVLPRAAEDLDGQEARGEGPQGDQPVTKEEVMFKAKPASVAVMIRPLKTLKGLAL